jgi:hypothetical protein
VRIFCKRGTCEFVLAGQCMSVRGLCSEPIVLLLKDNTAAQRAGQRVLDCQQGAVVAAATAATVACVSCVWLVRNRFR